MLGKSNALPEAGARSGLATSAIASDYICRIDPQLWFDMAALRVLGIQSSGDGKVIEADLATFKELVDKLISFVKESASECRKLIERNDKKSEAAALAEVRRAEAAKTKLAKKQRKAAMKKSVSAVEARKDGQIPVLAMKHDAITEMRAYTDLDDLKKAVKEGNLQPGIPYKVKSLATLRNCVDQRGVKSNLGVFRIQYPSTQMAKTDGRGQAPFHSEKSPEVRELMLEVAPFSAASTEADKDSRVAKIMSTVSMFGQNFAFFGTALERQGLAQLRYQVAGVREVLVTDFETAHNYLIHTGVERGEKDLFLWIAEGLEAIHTEEQLDALAQNGGKLYRTTVQPFELVSVPMGTIAIERVLGDHSVFGYRTSFTDKSEEAFGVLKNMMNCVAATKQDPSEDPVVKFWTEVVDLHDKAD